MVMDQKKNIEDAFRCGFIALIGRPNVGKSTLMNKVIGCKLTITSSKPQTTRHRISGILNKDNCQYIFVDTPGFQTKYLNRLNRKMNKVVSVAIETVDLIVFVMEAFDLYSLDESILSLIPKEKKIIVLLNKLDQVKEKASLLPIIQRLNQIHVFHDILPMSAKSPKDIEKFLMLCHKHLPLGEPIYALDQLTDRSERFLTSEIIREKIFRFTGDEIPYTTTVMVDVFENHSFNLIKISATIVVDHIRHKMIVVGKGGSKLRTIGTEARIAIERLLATKVYLDLFVKVKTGWVDFESSLSSYGYE